MINRADLGGTFVKNVRTACNLPIDAETRTLSKELRIDGSHRRRRSAESDHCTRRSDWRKARTIQRSASVRQRKVCSIIEKLIEELVDLYATEEKQARVSEAIDLLLLSVATHNIF
jgi:hypothetical protein